jgi:hypothetical protein
MYLISNNTKLKRIHQNKARISVVKGKRHQACKMPEALGSRLGARPSEPRQYAINIILYYIILYYINLKYISSQLRLDH